MISLKRLWQAEPPLPDIDSEQRWLVRNRDPKEQKRRTDRGNSSMFEIIIGEVSSNGRYFKLKSVYSEQWYELNEYHWLDQLL
jgi:hypothetical protein